MDLLFSNDAFNALRAFLETDADAEKLSESEYVADLYAADPAMTVNLVMLPENTVRVDGAATLLFSETMDGYYMDAPIADAAVVKRALLSAAQRK